MTKVTNTYHSNGKLWVKKSDLNGELHGTCETWHENGNQRYLDSYRHGQLHGPWKGWHDYGKLYYETWWINGFEASEDEWREYELTEQLAGIA